ncbi:hypothetical protein AESSP_01438 [Aestuariimicrobium sp. T2.26MG-19.2B]|nr:hypothetical protein AESSP_01438 [Aestuariimicrobium sp. T2.26MG-19.2B]
MGVTRFGIVGSGWRTRFLLRVAAASAGRLVPVGVVVRNPAKREQLTGWGVPIVAGVGDLADLGCEFVVAAVDWASMPSMIEQLLGLGHHVLAETPPAPDLDGLRGLWASVGNEPRVQIAEQYLLMPGHAARLAIARSGAIGQVTGVEVSSTHMYHAVSMIRGLLGSGDACPSVTALRHWAPLADPLGPEGARLLQPEPRSTTLAMLDFGAGVGLYDFVENQWWNRLRGRRIVVRGSLGEISDDVVTRLVDGEVVTSRLEYQRMGADLDLEQLDLRHVSFDGSVLWRNRWQGGHLSDDDLAVADLLAAAGSHARGEGPAPYPLAQACHDHAIALAIEQSADRGDRVTVDDELPWLGALAPGRDATGPAAT